MAAVFHFTSTPHHIVAGPRRVAAALVPLRLFTDFYPSPLNPLTALLKVMVWSSCSAILTRSVLPGTGRGAPYPSLNLSRVRTEDLSQFFGNLKLRLNIIAMVIWIELQLVLSFWECCLQKPKSSKLGLPEYSGLQSDEIFSFKERVLGSLSSLWERSISPLSSDMERTFPPLPHSSLTEETFGVQPQILPLYVDTILTGFKIRFLPNSTKLEPTFQSDFITSVMLHLSDDKHVDFHEILQVSQDLKKCFIFIYVVALIFLLVGYYALRKSPQTQLSHVLRKSK